MHPIRHVYGVYYVFCIGVGIIGVASDPNQNGLTIASSYWQSPPNQIGLGVWCVAFLHICFLSLFWCDPFLKSKSLAVPRTQCSHMYWCGHWHTMAFSANSTLLMPSCVAYRAPLNLFIWYSSNFTLLPPVISAQCCLNYPIFSWPVNGGGYVTSLTYDGEARGCLGYSRSGVLVNGTSYNMVFWSQARL